VKKFSFDRNRRLVLEIINQPKNKDIKPESLANQLIARVDLSYVDFLLARDETWWTGLRAGRLTPDLDTHSMRVIPGSDTGMGMLDGYVIELTNENRSYSRAFTNRSLANVANRKILEVSKENEDLSSVQDQYSYYIAAMPGDDHGDHSDNLSMNVKSCREPLQFEHAPLADFMANSDILQGVAEQPLEPKNAPMQIFVTQEVWEESKKHAFRGGECESAALFSGRLFRDTDSHEVFLRIDACLEAEHAVEEKLAVTFTGETWAHARKLLDIRRRRLNRPNEIIVGSVHRHPFLPSADADGNRKCEACSIAKYCSRSTAVPSTDDFEWHRSVFSGQPFGILLIWGYNAREEEEFRLYGLENATFKERTLRLLNGNL